MYIHIYIQIYIYIYTYIYREREREKHIKRFKNVQKYIKIQTPREYSQLASIKPLTGGPPEIYKIVNMYKHV